MEEEPLHFCVWCDEPAAHVCANCGRFVCGDCSKFVIEHDNPYIPEGQARLCLSCMEKIFGGEHGFLPQFEVKRFKESEETGGELPK